MSATLDLRTSTESWPIAGSFTISRGSKTEAVVVVAEISDGPHTGRGECVPYARYGETVEGVRADIELLTGRLAAGLDRKGLQDAMPAGAARNALDCAFWDLEAKRAGRRAWELAGLPRPDGIVTAYTLSLKSPGEMRDAAHAAAHRPLIKVKLGGDGDRERIAAVREGAPSSRLIVDANEGWTPDNLEANLDACLKAGVELVEQPLPASDDEALRGLETDVLVCADESAHDTSTLARLAGKYSAINIKLDKTGGLTEALALADAARDMGLSVMVGCMLATSLAMAPALLVATQADFVDLDGPLLLARDREPGLTFDGSTIRTPSADLWG
ncbi:MAG: dipeptide epimerase [Rhodobiaceae bacterium]|nr:dipeptide epimerase [Rhodobiaceae bacterium]MCC0016834.1 dipeptide epimerase [Rhodobiaceae bacterium]MCC0041470.1 dipeptide epimerase [Rhodobiaceae bacterium]